MSDTIMATSRTDAHAVARIEQHHAELAGALGLRASALVTAARSPHTDSWESAQADLVDWCQRELLPHAAAEEAALYPPAYRREAGRLLVAAMIDEHRVLEGLVAELRAAPDAITAVATAASLRTMFEHHATKENELILPLLAAAADVSLTAILAEMHDSLPHGTTDGSPATAGHACGCGEADGGELPVLDVRTVPHAIRHATVFGAIEAISHGGGMVLVAPHDPVPLLAQIQERHPGVFAIDYLERGPDAWRLQLTSRS